MSTEFTKSDKRGGEDVAVIEQTFEPDVDLSLLTEHPRNPRHGDDAAVGRSIDINGWYGVIVVQRSTGFILAGHTRRRSLLARGESTAPVMWVDCDDSTATRILLADNRTAELATWQEELLGLLQELTVDELAGTGFTDFDIEALNRQTDDLVAELVDEKSIEPNDVDQGVETECPACHHVWVL